MGTEILAMGNTNFPGQPFMDLGGGIQTPYGTLLPPGGRVAAYVRSTGYQDLDAPVLHDQILPTLAQGLARCRAGYGDTVVILPGHTENVVDATMLDNLQNGVRIIGFGRGSYKPTFRWTNTAGQWIIDNSDVIISGLKLRMEGANGVVKAVVITAADVCLAGNVMELASGATAKATIAIEIGSAAHRCEILSNIMYGTATHNVTDGIKIVGATPPSDVRIQNNEIVASATAANGLVHVTVACLGLRISENRIYNTHTASTSCITIDNVAANGMAWLNYLATVNDGVATAQGLIQGAGSLVRSFNNFSCDEPLKSGILTPAVVAT